MSNVDNVQSEQTSKRELNLSWLLYVVLASIGIVSIFIIWNSSKEASFMQSELARSGAVVEQLNLQLEESKLQEAELDAGQKQAKLWRRQLRDIYRQYRTVDDFAPNPSKLIIKSGTLMNDAERFSVPKGKHTLKVDVTKVDHESKEVIDQQQMSYDLTGNAGYVLKLDHSNSSFKKRGQLKLLLTSNAEGFTSVSEAIFEPVVSRRGTYSEGGHQVISFPNQIDRFLPMEDWGEVLGKGIAMKSLLGWSFMPTNQKRFDLNFDIRIVSAGPNVAGPETAPRYDRKGRYQLKYFGDGVYEVLENNE